MKHLTALASLLLVAAQDPAAKKADPAVDRVFLQDRSELQGEIVGLTAAGRLRIRAKESDPPLDLPLEEVSRIRFTTDETRPSNPAGELIRIAGGGTLGGKVTSYQEDAAVVETAAGPVRIARRDIKALLLSRADSPMPELQDRKEDVLIREVDKKVEGSEKTVRECVADYGRLRSIGEKVVFEVSGAGEGARRESREFDRATVRHVYLNRDEAAREYPPGFFAKVTMRNGDRWVAVLQGVGGGKARFFSHLFGTVEVEKSKVHTIAFISQAQLTAGNVIVTDQTGVHEFDSRGVEIWTYGQNVQAAAVARKLRNGNVLIANPNTNEVLEVRPAGRAGGEIVWRLEDVQNPYDVARLESGKTLVAERYNNRVAEYSFDKREVTWQAPAQFPMSAQRLENGNTLICTNMQVYEVNAAGHQIWIANLRAGAIRPFRAVRLENGNTLITDQQRGQVVEIDGQGTEVWKRSGLTHPSQAVRLEDGNTLILEQGLNRVIEVDAANPNIFSIYAKGLTNPVGMSIY